MFHYKIALSSALLLILLYYYLRLDDTYFNKIQKNVIA